MTPDKREQVVAAALRGGPIPTDTNELVQELLDTRDVLSDSLNGLQTAVNERDYLTNWRAGAADLCRRRMDELRAEYQAKINGLLDQIRRLEEGR